MPNIEEILRQAITEGKFEDLPGKGKPLKLDSYNPHADPAWELAYKMLKDAGYSLPWIETIRQIEADIDASRSALKSAWEWYQAARTEAHSTGLASSEWQRAQAAFNEQVIALNKRIRSYNLEVPNARFQRTILSFQQELNIVTKI